MIADTLHDAALPNPVLLENIRLTRILSSIQMAFLLAVAVISVQKTWKNKKAAGDTSAK